LQHLAFQVTHTSSWTLQIQSHWYGIHHALKYCLARKAHAVNILLMYKLATHRFQAKRYSILMKTMTSLDTQQVAVFMQIKSALGQPHASILSSTPPPPFKLICFLAIKQVPMVSLD
jgi:hypothetical protein